MNIKRIFYIISGEKCLLKHEDFNAEFVGSFETLLDKNYWLQYFAAYIQNKCIKEINRIEHIRVTCVSKNPKDKRDNESLFGTEYLIITIDEILNYIELKKEKQ